MILISTVTDSIVQFVTVTLIFIFVLGVTYFTTRWIGSYQKKRASFGNIQIIESARISSTKVLEIVKVGNKCFLIAVCKDTVTTLGEVDEESLDFPDDKSSGVVFGEVFSKFKFLNSGKDDNKSLDEEEDFDNYNQNSASAAEDDNNNK